MSRCNLCGQFLADFDDRTEDHGFDYHGRCWQQMMDDFRDEIQAPRFGESGTEFTARTGTVNPYND